MVGLKLRPGAYYHRDLSVDIMSASSGISVSQPLADLFAAAIESRTIRFLKVSIQNGRLDVSIFKDVTY